MTNNTPKNRRNYPRYSSSIVAIVNDSIKSYQALRKFGIQLVTSYRDLQKIEWGQVQSLIIQAELNWTGRRGLPQTTYDGYYLLIELLDWAIDFNGTVGFISRYDLDIYHKDNMRLFPFMKKVECQTIFSNDTDNDFDKRFLMNYYHTVFSNLQRDYDNGFIQLNTGGKSKKYIIKHGKGKEIVFAKYNINDEYIIRMKNFFGFRSKLGRVNLEHEVIDFIRREFAPVLKIRAIDLEY